MRLNHINLTVTDVPETHQFLSNRLHSREASC
jgi:hypothetical protein